MGLTVRELVALLQELPEEEGSWPVDVEGCDCVDVAVDIDSDKLMGRVMITRNLVNRTLVEPKPEPPNTGAPSKRWGV